MGASSSKLITAPRPPQEVLEEKMRSSMNSLSISATDATPLSSSGVLSPTLIENWESESASDPRTKLARTVLATTHIRASLLDRTAQIADQHVFNHVIDFKTGPRTDQKSSGRCWLFATTNVLRYEVMKKLNISEFELSQSYLFFWDKLNKSNYYLELSIENADKPLDDRLVYFLSDDLISDGGQWDMVVNVLEQYGTVPKAIYPESYSSSSSGVLNALLKTKLREHAIILRELYASLKATNLTQEAVLKAVRAKKEELMKEIYTIITATLGAPPPANKKFVFDYYNKDGKPERWEGTPVEFYKNVASGKYPPSDSFSLINDPRNEYDKLYTVDKLGNIWGGRPVLYVNTGIDNLKAVVVMLIKAGIPVFFGCDVGKHSDSTLGVMDLKLFDYDTAFNIKLGMTKKQRLQVNESAMTHAMVICGVHVDPETGKPVRYKVENSWGEKAGENGWFMMTDEWFSEYVFQIVVPKAFAPKELVKVFEDGNPRVLPAWDPMGSLA